MTFTVMNNSAYGGHGPTIMIVGWTFAAITTVLLAMRLFVRASKMKTGGTWALLWAVVAYVSIKIEFATSVAN